MKKFIVLIAAIVGLSFNNKLGAQNISININIGTQPAWGPTGYDYVDYYYMPDINVYYMVNSHNYVYYDRGRWITARYLPYRYRNYDLYGMYKVVMVGGPQYPWRYNTTHYRDYAQYRSHRGQSVIRDSRDSRYTASRKNNTPWYRESGKNNVTNQRPTNSTRPSSSSNSNMNQTRPTNNTRPSSATRPNNNNNTRPTTVKERSTSTSRSSSVDRSTRSTSSRSSATTTSGRSSSRR